MASSSTSDDNLDLVGNNLFSLGVLYENDFSFSPQGGDAKKSAFLAAVSRLNSRQEEEKRRMVEQSSKGASGGGGGERGGGKGGGNWSSDEMGLLIKAVNLFPAGETTSFGICTG